MESRPNSRACSLSYWRFAWFSGAKATGKRGCAWDQHANDVYYSNILPCIRRMTRARVWLEDQKRSCVPLIPLALRYTASDSLAHDWVKSVPLPMTHSLTISLVFQKILLSQKCTMLLLYKCLKYKLLNDERYIYVLTKLLMRRCVNSFQVVDFSI